MATLTTGNRHRRKKPITLKNPAKEAQEFKRRMLWIAPIVVVLSVLMITRLVYLQIYHYQSYSHLSDKNQIRVIPIPPNRGLIYDRHGVVLADNIPVFSLELLPNQIKNVDAVIAELQKIINIDEQHIDTFKQQSKQRRRFDPIPLRLQLTEEEVALFAVNQYRFPGVEVKARLMRRYPLGKAMAHVIGYIGRINEEELERIDKTNYRATNFIGKLGIERYFEVELHGYVGHEKVETNAAGRYLRVLKRKPPTPGDNLHLTIDSRLQQATETAMGKETGAAVVIDTRSGEILAMVSMPNYDPNLFISSISNADYTVLRDDEKQPLYNRAIRGQYPLASTIKPFLAIELLDQGLVDVNHRIDCPGSFSLPNSSHVFRDWRRQGHGPGIDIANSITRSCDVFFYRLATTLKISGISKVLRGFGFGELTGIEMQEELPGLVPSPEWKRKHRHAPWYVGDTVVASIGQGYLLTTPLQLASATALFAQRGKLSKKPHLLLKKTNSENEIVITNPNAKHEEKHTYSYNLKNKQHWTTIIQAMRDSIHSPRGTAHSRFRPTNAYMAAGKTGTAQVFSATFHTQHDEKNLPKQLQDHSIFLGFTPVDEPEIAVAVIAEHSKIAVQITREIMDSYYDLKRNPTDDK